MNRFVLGVLRMAIVRHLKHKLIILSFTVTEVSYPYSMSGQLNGSFARAALTGQTGTIFERIGTTTLSDSGTLSPGNYTLAVTLYASPNSSANFTFALDGPVASPTPSPT